MVRSLACEAGLVGSTPVLKIALPSSPLPEHRSDRIMAPLLGCSRMHSRCTRLPEQLRRSIHRPQDPIFGIETVIQVVGDEEGYRLQAMCIRHSWRITEAYEPSLPVLRPSSRTHHSYRSGHLGSSTVLNSVCRRFESDTLGTMIIFNTSCRQARWNIHPPSVRTGLHGLQYIQWPLRCCCHILGIVISNTKHS